MATPLELLTPGITHLFGRAGWTAKVTDVKGKLSVAVAKGHHSETREFPYPTINSDLSQSLISWCNQIQKDYP